MVAKRGAKRRRGGRDGDDDNDRGKDRRTLLPAALKAEVAAAAEDEASDAWSGDGDEGEEEVVGRGGSGRRSGGGRMTRKEARKAARKGKKRAGVVAKERWVARRAGKEVGGGKEGGGFDSGVREVKGEVGKTLGEGLDGGGVEKVGKIERGKTEKGKKEKGKKGEDARVKAQLQAAVAMKVPERDPEEIEQRRLEKLLGINKKRKKAKTSGRDFSYGDIFDDDEDMAALLDFCDTKESGKKGLKHIGDESESDEEEDGGRQRPDPFAVPDDEEVLGDDAEGLDGRSLSGSGSDGEEIGDGEDSEGSAEGDSDSEDGGESLGSDSSGSDPEDSDDEEVAKFKPASFGKYVPPSARVGASGGTAALSRRIRGLLNRLAGPNAQGIAESLARMFQTDSDGISRRELVDLYATVTLDAVCDGSGTGHVNPYLTAHAAIVTHLGATFDVSVTARVTVSLVRHLKKLLADPAEESRVVFGYVAFFGWLYDQRAIGCGMVYELVRLLSASLTEVNVELLLLLLRNVGLALRADDPGSLKDVILHIREQAELIRPREGDGEKGSNLTSRVDVMLDLIYEIKDNKSKRKEGGGDGGGGASTFSWVIYPSPRLEATFTDLLDDKFSERRWWEVDAPAAASRLTLGGRRDEDDGCEKEEVVNGVGSGAAVIGSGSLVSLAAAHRLNTDFRRQAFAAIMGSSDADDAMQRLDELSGFDKRNGRDRDTVRVVLHCCGAERVYNPFYFEIASRVCARSRALRFSFEFALWESVNENLRDGEKSASTLKRKSRNFGRLLGNLLKDNHLRLYALRVAPELDSCSVACSAMFVTAFDIFFSAGGESGSEGEDFGERESVASLCAEKGTAASAFRTALAVFWRRRVLPVCSPNVKKFVSSAIRAVEAAG